MQRGKISDERTAVRVSIQKTSYFLVAAHLGGLGAMVAALLETFVFYSPRTATFLTVWLSTMVALCAVGTDAAYRGRRLLAADDSPATARRFANKPATAAFLASVLRGTAASYLFLHREGYSRAVAVLVPCLIAAAGLCPCMPRRTVR